MSIRVILDNPPEFYTNLDFIKGDVVLSLSRHEHVGAIIVKLEGESRTALGVPNDNPGMGVAGRDRLSSGDTLHENHKILYRVGQVFPDENAPPAASPYVLNPGQHRFPFQFKFPFNNACGNTEAMARIGGVVNAGGMFGGGFRVMDGTKQLIFTGFPGEAEIRYYVKVTVQRPGIFKENWRYQMGLKFLPIEPPRPAKSNQEAYARRPFTFHPRSPSPAPYQKKRSSFFGRHGGLSASADGRSNGPPSATPGSTTPPSIEMSARLPHPAILTCNKSIPLRLIAKKLVPAQADVYLVAMQIELIGKTTVRCQDLINTEMNRWVILSRHGLSTLVSKPEDPVGTEFVVPDILWNDAPLPNTVMPSFLTCNLRRDYQLEIKLGLAWGKPAVNSPSMFLGRGKFADAAGRPPELHLNLQFSTIQVYSGLAPPAELVQAIRNPRPKPTQQKPSQSTAAAAAAAAAAAGPSQAAAPHLPPRPAQTAPTQPADALYPPQLGPGQASPPYDDAPPTYEEAMAEEMTGPVFPGAARPAYSGVTDENGPSSLGAGGGKG
ncbi:hypothetical protein B0I37DRAFT_418648 [Chaetomium sp. MPI-CAGE-AT-0009]|nr:hypothetical protein B0I37DRAFT_418648 [Chaetomium sp. MPI-CAGE-AT-0009]